MGLLNNKVALVTGAARGIGQAIAVTLAAEGADVALCDLQADWLAETAGRVQAAGRQARAYAVDVAQAEAVPPIVSQIHQDFGHVDILVNNAGITRDNLMLRMSVEDWNAVLNVNLTGAFVFTKAVSRIMIKQRSGAIVNIASIIGLIGNAGQCNYSASKAGLVALTKSAAKELAGRNVRVNAVAPGFIKSHMTDKLSADLQQKMLGAIPLGRFGVPEDVAKVVAFLASDDAAYVTGQVVNVCGGMVT